MKKLYERLNNKVFTGGSIELDEDSVEARTDYLAIISNDESGIIHALSFDTLEELNKFCETVDDGINMVMKYKATKLS